MPSRCFGLSSSPNVSGLGPVSRKSRELFGPETFGEELKPKHRDRTYVHPYVVSLFFVAGCPVLVKDMYWFTLHDGIFTSVFFNVVVGRISIV